MTMLNPNHPVTKELEHEWHKLLMIFMVKQGVTRFEITPADVDRWTGGNYSNILAHAHRDTLEIRLIGDAEAARILGGGQA